MGRIIAIVSGKGGVGKTTITANLGIALAKRNLNVCIVWEENIPVVLGFY